MSAWLLRLCAARTAHIPMPSLADTLAAPTPADERFLLPLLRLNLDALGAGRDDWPPVAHLMGYHLYDYRPLMDRGGPWTSFAATDDGRLAHEIPSHAFLDQDLLGGRDRERVRLALADGVEAVQLAPRADLEATWKQAVEGGAGVGILSDEPIWLPSDSETPVDDDGAPMTYVGQFRADRLTEYSPSFVFWLYWSPRTRTFAQLDWHD